MATPPSPNHAFSIVKTARKLPVKRKPQTHPPEPSPPHPTLNPPPLHPHDDDDDEDDADPPSSPDDAGDAGRSGSYRYNRLWSEADEIRFLRAVLQSRSDGYRFPRDMPRFYDRFRDSMTGSYTRTQFSEKLRRLRKKFRHVSGRVERHGAAAALKTAHEKVVYELSRRLWVDAPGGLAEEESDSKDGDSSPAAAGGGGETSVGGLPPETVVIIRHEPTYSTSPPPLRQAPPLATAVAPGGSQPGGGRTEADDALVRVTADTVMGVLDDSIKDVRTELASRAEQTGLAPPRGRGKKRNLKREWGKQQIAEFDVLSQRLRLVLETAVNMRNPPGFLGRAHV